MAINRMIIRMAVITALMAPLANAEQVSLQRAEGETLSSAVAHFARARSLIIAAVREFDAGRKLADPGALIDSESWRALLVARAEDLERVLDPKPRATKGGVRFDADPRLLGLQPAEKTP